MSEDGSITSCPSFMPYKGGVYHGKTFYSWSSVYGRRRAVSPYRRLSKRKKGGEKDRRPHVSASVNGS